MGDLSKSQLRSAAAPIIVLAFLFAAGAVPFAFNQAMAAHGSPTDATFSPSTVKAAPYESGHFIPTKETPGQSITISLNDASGNAENAMVQGFMYAPTTMGGGLREVFEGVTQNGRLQVSALHEALNLSDAWLAFNAAAETQGSHSIILWITSGGANGVHVTQSYVPIKAIDFLNGASYSVDVRVPTSPVKLGPDQLSTPGCSETSYCKWMVNSVYAWPSSGYYGQIPITWATTTGSSSATLAFTLSASYVTEAKTGFEVGAFGLSTPIYSSGTVISSVTASAFTITNQLNTPSSATIFIWGTMEGDLLDMYQCTNSNIFGCQTWSLANCSGQPVANGAQCQAYNVGITSLLTVPTPGSSCPSTTQSSSTVSTFTESSTSTTPTTSGALSFCLGWNYGVPALPSSFYSNSNFAYATYGTYPGHYSGNAVLSSNIVQTFLQNDQTSFDGSIDIGGLIAALVGGPLGAVMLSASLTYSVTSTQMSWSMVALQPAGTTPTGTWVNVLVSYSKTPYNLPDLGLTGYMPMMGFKLTSTTATPMSASVIPRPSTGIGCPQNDPCAVPLGTPVISSGSSILLSATGGSNNPFDYWSSSTTGGASVSISCTSCAQTTATITGSSSSSATVYGNFYAVLDIRDGDMPPDYCTLNPGPPGNQPQINSCQYTYSQYQYHYSTTVAICEKDGSGDATTFQLSNPSIVILPPPNTDTAPPSCISVKTLDATDTVWVHYTTALALIYFTETGLPSGVTWTVNIPWYLASNPYTYSGTTSGTSIQFLNFPDGSYSYTINSVPSESCNYAPNPSSGSEFDQSVSVTFTGTCTAQFFENNLPSGTSWTVTFNGVPHTSTTNSLTIPNLAPGSYSWSVNAPSAAGCTYSPNPASGTYNTNTIPGQSVTYTGSCTQTYTESGLPSGTLWYITQDGVQHSSTGTTITFSGSPPGSHTWSSTFISCGSGCQYAPNYISGGFAQPPYSGAGLTYTLQYSLITWQSLSGCGSTSPAGTTWHNAGTTVGISESTASGCSLSRWIGTGTISYSGSASSATVTMNSPIDEEAVFTTQVTFSESGLPSGTSWTVTFDGTPHSSTATSITLTGIGSGSHSYSISTVSCGTGCQRAPSPASGTLNPTGPTTVNVGFTLQYQVSFAVNPSGGGSTSPAGSTWVNSGSQISISASPSSGYGFSSWSATSGLTVTCPTCSSTTLTVGAAGTATANFNHNTYYLTMAMSGNAGCPSSGCYVTPSSGYFTSGQHVTITAGLGTSNPCGNYNWFFIQWTGTGAGSYTGSSYQVTITMPSNAITETAVYGKTRACSPGVRNPVSGDNALIMLLGIGPIATRVYRISDRDAASRTRQRLPPQRVPGR